MSLNDNIYALSRWNQDVLNNFDEQEADEGQKWNIKPEEF